MSARNTFVGFSSIILQKQSNGSRVVPVHTKGQKDIHIPIVCSSRNKHQSFKHKGMSLTTNFKIVEHGQPVYVLVDRKDGVTHQLFVGSVGKKRNGDSEKGNAVFNQIVSNVRGSDDMADQSDIHIPLGISTSMCSAIVYPLDTDIDREFFFVGTKSDLWGPHINESSYSTLLRVYMT